MRKIFTAVKRAVRPRMSASGFSLENISRRRDKAQFCGGRAKRARARLLIKVWILSLWIPRIFIVVIHRAVFDASNRHQSNKEPHDHQEWLRSRLFQKLRVSQFTYDLSIVAFYLFHISASDLESDKSGSYIATNNFNFIVQTIILFAEALVRRD